MAFTASGPGRIAQAEAIDSLAFGVFSADEAVLLDGLLADKGRTLASLPAGATGKGDALAGALARRAREINDARKMLYRHLAYLSDPLPFASVDYRARTSTYVVRLEVDDLGRPEVDFVIPAGEWAGIKSNLGKISIRTAQYLHPQLGLATFAAVLVAPDGKLYAAPLLDWPRLAVRLTQAGIYGYCPIARSAQELREQDLTSVPPRELQMLASAEAHAALASAGLDGASPYGRWLDASALDFDVTVQLPKEQLRQLGLDEAELARVCADCPTYGDSAASSAYDHGRDDTRTLRNNPVARQFYTLAFAQPVRRNERRSNPGENADDDPQVFRLRDGNGEAPSVCAPQRLERQLAPMRATVDVLQRNALSWRQLAALLKDFERRLGALQRQRLPAESVRTATRRQWGDLASGSAYDVGEGRCTTLDADTASRAERLLATANVVVRHCPDCENAAPYLLRYRGDNGKTAVVERTWTRKTVKVPGGGALAQLDSDGVALDLGNAYAGDGRAALTNVGLWAGCRVLFRDAELPPAAYTNLLNGADAKAAAERRRQDMATARATAEKARALLKQRKFSAAADVLARALNAKPAPAGEARSLLLSVYDVVGNSLDADTLDGAPAAVAFLKPTIFDAELEAELAEAPEDIQGRAVILTGKVLQNILKTGDLIEVRRARILVTPGAANVPLNQEMGATITVYGRFEGEFEYAPGRTVPIVKAVWVDR